MATKAADYRARPDHWIRQLGQLLEQILKVLERIQAILCRLNHAVDRRTSLCSARRIGKQQHHQEYCGKSTALYFPSWVNQGAL